MNPDTAEMAIVEAPVELGPAARAHGTRSPRVAVRRARQRLRARLARLSLAAWLTRLRADPARMAAVRESWRALALSRALVWAAGVGAILTFGVVRGRAVFNPLGITRGLGALGDVLAGPAARWDGAWYLVIAHYGYRPDLGSFTSSRTAFFPLYPLGVRALSGLAVPPVLAGVGLSLAALFLALYGIHRLIALELERTAGLQSRGPGGLASFSGGRQDRGPSDAHPDTERVAQLAVLLMAFAPMAFFLSAVYSESLYLALSVGVFWCGRQGRWGRAAALGALAAATRSTGVVLALPLLILYLYGPREDRAPDHGAARAPRAQWTRALRPRYRPRGDLLWLALVPAGTGAYMAYLALSGGEATLPFHAQEVWSRHFAGPFVGVWYGLRAAFDGVRQLLSGQGRHAYFTPVAGDPLVAAGHDVTLFAFLALAVPMLVGTLRRLPFAYGAYVLAALALPLSYPVATQPLMSLPRFLLVLFPLVMWLALWLAPRPRAARAAVLASALLMALLAGEFATWHWVA
jgi:hypothetical protein